MPIRAATKSSFFGEGTGLQTAATLGNEDTMVVITSTAKDLSALTIAGLDYDAPVARRKLATFNRNE